MTYEWDAEKNDYVGTDTGISAMGTSTYVVDKTSYWELHVATSEMVKANLLSSNYPKPHLLQA